MVEKACTCCGGTFPATLDFFSPRSTGKLGLVSRCKPCQAQKARESRIDPEIARRHRASVSKCAKKRYDSDAEFRDRERERLKLWKQNRRETDPVWWQAELARDRAWRKANWDRVKKYKHKCGPLNAAHVMARYAAKLKATPPWSNLKAISEIYEEARRKTEKTGIEHHVDHIIPLQGRNVRGLHVPANLRVITADENKRKSNRFIHELAVNP